MTEGTFTKFGTSAVFDVVGGPKTGSTAVFSDAQNQLNIGTAVHVQCVYSLRISMPMHNAHEPTTVVQQKQQAVSRTWYAPDHGDIC